LTDLTWRQASFKTLHTIKRNHKLHWQLETIKIILSVTISGRALDPLVDESINPMGILQIKRSE